MAEVDLGAPELDVDEEHDGFRRVVAVLVVLITLFGAVIAYAQSVESNDEDVAARNAQRDAIRGLGAQVEASAGLAADARIGSSIDAVLQQQALAAAQVEAIGGEADRDAAFAERERLAEVAAAVGDLTPIDPSDDATFFADAARRNADTDEARLSQSVEADRANDHGGKADAYVTILTVLAVALFLLGLSLTVKARNRYVLAAPGVAIAVVCILWAIAVSGRDVTRISSTSVADVAEGQRLQDAGDFAAAIERYDEAIADSPDFAAAYARRAGARFLQGSPQRGQTGFISLTSEEALADALDDVDEALRLGGSSDVNTVADAGFFHFLDGDFERSVELSSDAVELNPSLAALWFNLGVAQVGLGDEAAAEDAYEEGLEVLFDPERPPLQRAEILAGARTDLSILRTLLDDELDDVLDLVLAMESELATAQLEATTCPDGNPCEVDADADDAELGEVSFGRDGADVFADIEVDGLEEGTAVAVTWYMRTAPDTPFEQTALGFQASQVVGGVVEASTLPVFQPRCPVVGDYLVRVYAGGTFLGEAAASIAEEITSIDPDEEGTEIPDGGFGVGTPLGSRFTGFADPIEGFEACIPEGFEVDQQDVSELDAFTTFSSEDVLLVIGINVTPGSTVEGQDQQALEDLLIANTGPDAEVADILLPALDIDGEFLFLEGTSAITEVDGIGVATAIAVGPDNSTRTILLTGDPSLPGLLDGSLLREVAATVTFTGVDDAAG